MSEIVCLQMLANMEFHPDMFLFLFKQMERNMINKLVVVAVLVGISGCGGSGIPVTVETPGLDSLVSTITDISNDITEVLNDDGSTTVTTVNDDGTTSTVVNPPVLVARPEIVENYQYECFATADRSRVWTWTLRPELDIADQYGAITGRWDWLDNLTLIIKPTGNDQVLASLDESTENEILFLEDWGRCTSDSVLQIGEQFTRPD